MDNTCDLIKDLRKRPSGSDICNCVLDFAKRVGATHLLAGVIPPPAVSRTEQLAHILLSSWPREWSERYFSSGYLYRDPTIRLVRQGTRSFAWGELDTLSTTTLAERSLMNEAREFRLRQGFTMTLSTLERQTIGFSVAGERLEVDPRERLTLEFVANYAVACALAVASNSQHLPKLSQRQLDALRWAAEGLTADQIAEQLRISCHTADMHLRIVREKLGVVTTLHAVAEALRLGIIF